MSQFSRYFLDRARHFHEKAVATTARYFSTESELLDILKIMDAELLYLAFECTSLMHYAESKLGLTRDVAANFINVARKAKQVPELQHAIERGAITVSKARKIVPVLTRENHAEWIEKSRTSSAREVERDVASICPKEAVPERMKFITGELVTLMMNLSVETTERMKRVQDLESQRLRRAATWEDVLGAMAGLYLERKDPVVRAKRIEAQRERRARGLRERVGSTNDQGGNVRASAATSASATPSLHVTGHVQSNSIPLSSPPASGSNRRRDFPAALQRQLDLRDKGQCAHINSQGRRCEQRRWLDVHHLVEVSQGGADALDNLMTLCSAHHRLIHISVTNAG
jgi:5-methylcytosine-specific restriction endonuclease McrA